jgi:hypothetical protein
LINGNAIEGVGSVLLKIRKSKTDPSSISEIMLDEVLYAPDQERNTLGCPFLDGFRFVGGPVTTVKTFEGEHLGYFNHGPPYHLWLDGREAEHSSLSISGSEARFTLDVRWASGEMKKWEDEYYRVRSDIVRGSWSYVPAYTEDEKQYLKNQWGWEERFLRKNNLGTDDHEKGRLLLLAFVARTKSKRKSSSEKQVGK